MSEHLGHLEQFRENRIRLIIEKILALCTKEGIRMANINDYSFNILETNEDDVLIDVVGDSTSTKIRIPNRLILLSSKEDIEDFVTRSINYIRDSMNSTDSSESQKLKELELKLQEISTYVEILEERVNTLESESFGDIFEEEFEDSFDEYIIAQDIKDILLKKSKEYNLDFFNDLEEPITINSVETPEGNIVEILYENVINPENSILIKVPELLFYLGESRHLEEYAEEVIKKIQRQFLKDGLLHLNAKSSTHYNEVLSYVDQYLKTLRNL